MPVGHFQTSAMDAAEVLSECFPVLEIVRMQASAVKSNPGALEPCKGLDCTDVTADRFFVGEMPYTALCQAVIILRRGAPFHSFEILRVGAQVQGDVPPLNKIGEMPSIPSEIGSQVENILVMGTRSL